MWDSFFCDKELFVPLYAPKDRKSLCYVQKTTKTIPPQALDKESSIGF